MVVVVRASFCTLTSLALAAGPGCVEIDPSYGESYSSTTIGPGSGSGSSGGSSDAEGSTTESVACECSAFELCEAEVCTQPARILFVNLDGVTASFGVADASQDSHNLYEELAGTWAGYGADAATRETLLETVAAQWEPYRVVVTDQRPAPGSAPYVQAVVTADPPPAGFEGVASIAFPDCGDAIVQDMLFVFAAPGDGFGVHEHAKWTGRSFGRTFGLLFNEAADDLMGFGDRFTEACHPNSGGATCAAHHHELCGGDMMMQSSQLELEAILGGRG